MVFKSILTQHKGFRPLIQGSKFVALVRRQSVWTQDKVIKSPYKNVEVPNSTLYEHVWQNLDRWPGRTASVCAETGRGYTYEQAFKLSNTFAANLRTKLKITDGDVVAVMLPNIPDFPLVSMGILEAGGVITSINPIYTAHEVQQQLRMSSAKVIITLPETLKVIKEAFAIAKQNIPIIVVKTYETATPEGTLCFNELSEDVHVDTSILRKVKRNADDICFLPYSSGTTGLPKGVMLTHRNIIANMQQINEPAIVCHNETTASHQDIVLAVLPFFHIYAATVIMFDKMSLGVKMVTLPKFQPNSYFTALEKCKTNILFVAPPLVLLMGSHPAASSKSLQYIETIMNGAAPLAASDVERFLNKAQKDITFRQGYGLTETSPVVSVLPISDSKTYNSSGPPIPSTELRIVDKNMKNLGPNETGEVLVRGPQVMQGYLNNPQATKEVFTEDGWFRTGDLAVTDEKGFITIADRLKELIKVKGFQVPPAELEAVLREHPAVDDAAVIGVPHATNGEAPKAFITLKKGKEFDTKDIAEFVKERVAPYKRVTDINVIDVIPKSASEPVHKITLLKFR